MKNSNNAPRYTMITVRNTTPQSSTTRTYFINVETLKKSPSINNMSRDYITLKSDYVIDNGKLVKCRGDLTEILLNHLVSVPAIDDIEVEETIPTHKKLSNPTETQRSLINLRDELLKSYDCYDCEGVLTPILGKINSCLYGKYD